MQFKNVIGQKAIKEQLVHMAQHNRLSHAMLFLGKEGNGALSLAMAFAQYIICEKNSPYKKVVAAATVDLFASSGPSLFGEDAATAIEAVVEKDQMNQSDSCGICPACIKANQLMHPDIHFVFPVITKKDGGKQLCKDLFSQWREFVSLEPYGNSFDWLQFIGAENKQGNITAEECNEINKKISLKSFESGYKVLIIWMPEYLGNSGNKLLKLIEEPPPNTLFILVAENEDMILPTILSRTQLVKIPVLKRIDLEAALELRAGASVEKAAQIAALAEGNYREALHLLQHADDDWQAVLREWLNMIVKRNHTAQIKWIEDMAKQGREKQKQFLQYFTHLLELAVRTAVINPAQQQQNAGNEYDFAIRLNKLCSTHQQAAIIKELDKASYFIERNANGKMLFHALTIKLYHIISNNSLILIY
jgi:DNA polymerase-3 subunit delta'